MAGVTTVTNVTFLVSRECSSWLLNPRLLNTGDIITLTIIPRSDMEREIEVEEEVSLC